MTNEPIIELSGVSRQYETPEFSGVKDISFSIGKGQLVAIVGESGSGKSTLLKLIYGLLSPQSGTVKFKGEQVMGPEEKLIPGHPSMKMVTQDFELNTYAKVYDNIAGMLSNADLSGKHTHTVQIMELLRIDHLSAKRVADLSGGEQQRVAIARAMITGPEVLLLDEPFSQVDTIFRNQLRRDLKSLSRQTGTTVVLVSHDPIDGLSLADELLVIQNGELLEKGSPRQLYQRPATIYTARLLANCSFMTSDEAQKFGIRATKPLVAVYPEWVLFKNEPGSVEGTITDRYYKGFYEELIVEREGISLKVANFNGYPYEIGEVVRVAIRKMLEF